MFATRVKEVREKQPHDTNERSLQDHGQSEHPHEGCEAKSRIYRNHCCLPIVCSERPESGAKNPPSIHGKRRDKVENCQNQIHPRKSLERHLKHVPRTLLCDNALQKKTNSCDDERSKRADNRNKKFVARPARLILQHGTSAKTEQYYGSDGNMQPTSNKRVSKLMDYNRTDQDKSDCQIFNKTPYG